MAVQAVNYFIVPDGSDLWRTDHLDVEDTAGAEEDANIPIYRAATFDGSTTYILDPSGAVDFGTDDYTIEFWMNRTASSSKEILFSGDSGSACLYLDANACLGISGTGFDINFSGQTFSALWYHVAVVRSGGTTTLYVNGDSVGTSSTSYQMAFVNYLKVGESFKGSLGGVVICSGAKYTAAFAPPATASQYADLTTPPVELLHIAGDTVEDLCGHILQNTGVVSDANAQFLGKNTLYFNGSNASATLPLYCGKTADFTIDFWCKSDDSNLTTNFSTLEWRSDFTTGAGFIFQSSNYSGWNCNYLSFGASSSYSRTYHSMGKGWNHCAVVKKDGICYFYVNGVLNSTTVDSSNYMQPSLLSLGKASTDTTYFTGHLAHIRICSGARWTQNFAVPNTKADYNDGGPKKYDITNGASQIADVSFRRNTVLECNYSGSAVSLTLPEGSYKLECWGASGGYYSMYNGGRGGYSQGILTLEADTDLFLYAGGIGSDYDQYPSTTTAYTYAGGFNGGGSAQIVYYSSTRTIPSGGGGSTDIRIGTDSLYARVIVAGGGSGGSTGGVGYAGGGESSKGYSSTYVATQTAAGSNGSFGVGASAKPSSTNYKYAGSGGGGGWYGGGTTGTTRSDSTSTLPRQSGGGSGYVYTVNTKGNYPSGCLLNDTYLLTEASTTDGESAIPEISGMKATESMSGHAGYIRITVLKALPTIYVKLAGGWKKILDIYCRDSSGWVSIIESEPSAIRDKVAESINYVSPSDVKRI